MGEESYDACIVGAGIAGLNALVVAAGYLDRSSRVLLVDSRPRAGGMWVDTYDYVRLHQPHGIFTAGEIGWTLGREPSYLASKQEVLQHLDHCLDVARRQVTLDERFGWELVSHAETSDAVVVTLRGPDGDDVEVRTDRLIKAFGHAVRPNPPLVLSSSAVRSITPESAEAVAALSTDHSPVWIVGGGKTAMDTAHVAVSANPAREVHLLAGPGTVFSRREAFFPTGPRRWWGGGTRVNAAMRDLALRFDGSNGDEVRSWFLARYGTAPVSGATDFFGAYLSDKETAVIRDGLSTIAREYLTDVVDTASGPQAHYRSGRTEPVAEGSWVVNCTGSLLQAGHPYEPFVSPTGRVLSLQMRSSTTGVFSSFAGYFLTHLMFRDQLLDSGLCELDIEDLYSKNKSIVIYASMVVSMHNLAVLSMTLPNRVMLGCGLDYDRWYPAHRRLYGATMSLVCARSDRRRHLATLGTLHDRYGVRAGPLVRD